MKCLREYSYYRIMAPEQRLLLPQRVLTVLGLALILSGCGGDGISGNTQAPDPVVQDFAIAYVKRPIPVDQNGTPVADDLREPASFNPGAELILRERASPSAAEMVLSAGVFAPGEGYDVKDLEASFDGRKLAFAMRAPDIPGASAAEQPTWNLWEYDLDSMTLRRMMTSDITAAAGQDISPRYLPDGSILFASTRQQANKAILLDEGKPQYSGLDENRNVAAFTLHIMASDGSNIRQITFNQSHDLDPWVMNDGKIVFSRWEHAPGNNEVSLYRVDPSGQNLELYYGHLSHATGTNNATIQFTRPYEMPDGQVMVLARHFVSTRFGAELIKINTAQFVENNLPTQANAGLSGPAQSSLTAAAVPTDGSISKGGYYNSAFPLYDGTDRLLVSWSPCRLTETDSSGKVNLVACTDARLADPAAVEASQRYGIWMLDQQQGTVLPIVVGEEGVFYTGAVSMQPRPLSTYIPDPVPGIDIDQNLVNEGVGILDIRNLYDVDGIDITAGGIAALADPGQTTANARPFRFIRIVKPVSIPGRSLLTLPGTAFGRSSAQGMRDILGYAAVEPDGSVRVKLPANVPFAISVLDKNGQRVSGRHNNWLQLRPGQILSCNGCHIAQSGVAHGRFDAVPPSIYTGAPTTGIPFTNTDPALFADMGETMAQVWARIRGERSLSVNINYRDDWTDPALRARDPSFSYDYADLSTRPPTSPNCIAAWSTNCRISINYADNIQPIFELPRITLDVDGATVLKNNTCTRCHAPTDTAGVVQIPAQQLDLTGNPSTEQPDQLTGYRELLFSDNEQEIVNGALIDRLVQAVDGNGNLLFEVDINGDLILDAKGDPIPVMITVPVSPPLNVNGAQASPRFFNLFKPGGTHAGRLTPAELKLMAEWLDIGGQYYNNPFDVPQN